MKLIKNLHLLTGHVSPADVERMEYAAALHRTHSNITFKIVQCSDQDVIIQAAQGRSEADNYFPAKRLIEIVHDTFDRFFDGKRVKVHPIEYKQPESMSVTAEWIRKQMLDHSIKLKTIAEDTGIDYTQLSAITSGTRQLSKPMKALFYYYFLATTRK